MKLGLSVFTCATLAITLSSCFAPNVASSDGACASMGYSVYGTWKQIRGYPSSWSYGGSTPSRTQLEDSYRIMIVERGGQMCSVAVVNQGINADPRKSTVFRAQYAHDVEKRGLEIDYTYPSNAPTQSSTYSITGCDTKPQLTIRYPDGREVVFEVFSRNVSTGQCANAPAT